MLSMTQPRAGFLTGWIGPHSRITHVSNGIKHPLFHFVKPYGLACMTVQDLLNCAKPLLFENEEEDYQYSLGGTCFLAKFRGSHYAITASHCLRGYPYEAVRIDHDPQDSSFLPLSCFHRIEPPTSSDTDWADVTLIEVAEKLLTEHKRNSSDWLDVDYLIQRDLSLHPGMQLAFRGFPFETGEIDYDEKSIARAGFCADASFVRQSSYYRCHIVKFNDLTQIKDVNGLSGSPLFPIVPVEGGSAYHFAGMLIRGSSALGLGYFIETSVIFRALLKLRA